MLSLCRVSVLGSRAVPVPTFAFMVGAAAVLPFLPLLMMSGAVKVL